MKHDPLIFRIFVALLCCLFPLCLYAQKGLQIATLFQKYGNQKNVTMVQLHGSALTSYGMTVYKSLTFKDVTLFLDDVTRCIRNDAASEKVSKSQEIVEDGILRSAYYQLSSVRRGEQMVNRYLLFKRGKHQTAALVYIEGGLDEEKLMDILYNKQDQ